MKTVAMVLLLSLLSGCGVVDRVELLVCDGHGGIKSYHSHGDLEVTCQDGTVHNIEWL